MRHKKEYIAVFGLLLITLWAALQYIFLQNVPDSVSNFAFLFLTYSVGLALLALLQVKKLKRINGRVLCKGMVLAAELVGFNFFMLLGSKGMESVVISSLVSMYFIFVPPILLLLGKRVSFRSAVASAVAVIALILLFNADTSLLFHSVNVIFLAIADLFFAGYVITIAEFGDKEDSGTLTVSQLLFSVLFSFAGWCIETLMGGSSFSLPADKMFWVTALFFGVFIRGLYSLIQVSCQKYVKPVNASLIFSSEIILTLVMTPFLSKLMHVSYVPASIYQVIGCFLFVIAVLVVDDTVMGRIGFHDMEIKTYLDKNGVQRTQSTVSRKMTNMTLLISMAALVLMAAICLGAIASVKDTAIGKNVEFGRDAAVTSEDALKKELETELINAAVDKAELAEAKLQAYMAAAQYAADCAGAIYSRPFDYPEKEVSYPIKENIGLWAMQRVMAQESIPYDQVAEENKLLGNLEGIFQTIVQHSENIATIYIGTETGLLISYDPDTGDTDVGRENYYEFREADWYQRGKQEKEPFFSKAYQDRFGRGLTITCVTPVYDESGQFRGSIGMDILMNDINSSMVNDNVIAPNYAELIDNEGYIIASRDVDSQSSGSVTIYDEDDSSPIKAAAGIVLSGGDGIAQVGEENDAIYISYAGIPHTDWVLCIMSPVAHIIRPAVSIRNAINRNAEAMAGTVNDSIRQVINSCLVLFAVILLVITFFAGKLSERISSPLQRLEMDVIEISRGNFDQRTLVSTDDEIGSLARAFNDMTESLQQHLAHLRDMTAKEERIASELSVATKIQADMLPRVFPAFPDRTEFDIYASMKPAKEVGGDFYDFFLVDEDHLALVMADVSGKGVPAALFMMISKTMIKSAAQAGISPKAVLEKVNRQLCENNKEEMFVTVWLGVLEISSGRMACVNAGHEFPAVRRKGERFTLFQDPHGFVLAGMEDSKYEEYLLELHTGDALFVYTDGVAEATDASNSLYGTERMLSALNRAEYMGCEAILAQVDREINQFVGDAPQFDDITMLCFEYRGAGQRKSVDNKKHVFRRLTHMKRGMGD